MLSETKNSVSIQKLEYIQSTGTQRIDTGYIPKVNTVLEMDIQFVKNEYEHANNLPKGTTNTFFGCIDSVVEYFCANFGGGAAQEKEIYFWNDKSNNNGGLIRSMYCGNSMYNRNVLRMERDRVKYTSELSLTPKSQNHKNRTLYLFGVNTEMSEGNIFTFIRHDMKLYSCKIYEDEVLIKDFIPAMRGEKIGLYDQVEKKFYENIGTGEFLYSDYELYPVDSQNRFLIKK